MSYVESKIVTDTSGNVIFTGDGTTANPLSANTTVSNVIGAQGIHKVGNELRLGIDMDNLSTGIIDQFARIQSIGTNKTQEFDINPNLGYWLTSRNNNNDSAQLLLHMDEDPIIYFQAFTSLENTELTLRKNLLNIYSSSPTFAGITYSADYSTNYTNRSLVDKEYVDNAVSGGGNSTFVTDRIIFTYDGTNNTQTLSDIPVDSVITFLNTSFLDEDTDYSYTGNTITIEPSLLTEGIEYKIITKYFK